ncbi:polysaccharide deacetylase family protein [Ideonella livida]|uniref:polysaccharide deacetylase family protein n=1 Tax=Ideonella livida TaxID=2707176 RepID=UPI0035BFC512
MLVATGWIAGPQAACASSAVAAPPCARPLYLTFDTGHMGVARLVADTLRAQGVRATFFLAHERTLEGGGSLDDGWAPWWRELAQAGHRLASHTFDHVYWLADRGDGGFTVRASAGPDQGVRQNWTAARYCAEVERSQARIRQMTGQEPLPLFRAPGGKTSPALLQAAQACGYQHVGWSAAGFLGDELPSDRFPNERLLRQALDRIQPGDILVAHLGIWSRQDPWAPAVLAPLLQGLKARGFCFATVDQHPRYGRSHPLP